MSSEPLDLSMEEKIELLDFHFQSMQGTFFSEYIERENYLLLFSDIVEDSWWNCISFVNKNLQDIVEETRSEFEDRDRKVAFYLPEFSDFNKKSEIPENFSKWSTDSWLVLKDKKPLKDFQVPGKITLRIVREEEKETFAEVFHNAYSGGPDDPYGELPEYFDRALIKSFERPPSGYERIYVLAEIDGEPAGVGILVFNNEIAGIYALGTSREHRKKGIGTSITKFMMEKALDNNVNKIMLQTEKGSKVEEWYKSLGFERAFLASYYVEEGEDSK